MLPEKEQSEQTAAGGPGDFMECDDEATQLRGGDAPAHMPSVLAERSREQMNLPGPNLRPSTEQPQAPAQTGGVASLTAEYGVLWRRVLAAMIDACIMGAAGIVVFWVTLALSFALRDPNALGSITVGFSQLSVSPLGPTLIAYSFLVSFSNALVPLIFPLIWILVSRSNYLADGLTAAYLAQVTANALYASILESSPLQATVGKHLLGLTVSDVDGKRLSLPRALLRHLGKAVSFAPLAAGLVMALFSRRQQCLHDAIAGTVVVDSCSSAAGAVQRSAGEVARIRRMTAVLSAALLISIICSVTNCFFGAAIEQASQRLEQWAAGSSTHVNDAGARHQR